MNRCLRASALLACSLTLAAAAPAQQPVRAFPDEALRGVLEVTRPPEILLDGRTDRLSPGARIRGPRNELVMSASLVGQRLVVNYVRETQGLVHEVWLLNEQEAALKRPGARRARNFVFASEQNDRPRDDGKTPFHLLPKYGQ
ncbi:hypothetical protein [Pseudorhodoferax sp.]|uniref:hypothetical protein n=1 Tax=Pseudorhodoferax sp. TaxID=1993553 RepID=UPI0039E62595